MNGIIFTGLQASGKSSFFKERFVDTHIRLNLDMLNTRNRENILFNACLEAKQPVVIDNTNPQIKDRERYIKDFKANKFKVIGYFFESKIKDCIERNNNRVLKKEIPVVALKSTSAKLEIPSYKEGFDELYFVKIVDNEFIVEEWAE